MKGASLRVLVVGDSEEEASLWLGELTSGGFEVSSERVQTAAQMAAALDRGGFGLVLSEQGTSRVSALDAFGVLARKDLDIPFILVSAGGAEDAAVSAMKVGVHDYVLKGNLARLTPAVERELRAAEARRTHRRSESEPLSESQNYRAIFDASPLPMWVFDVSSLGFLAVNEAAVRRYGYSRAEFLEMTLADIRPLEDVDAPRESPRHLESSASPQTWRHKKRDGSTILVEIEAYDLPFAGRLARIALMVDVTERLRLQEALQLTEEQLRQSQKMEAVGRLAGGIAHDFNNILSIILSYCGMMLAELRDGDPLRDDLVEIKKAGERAAELTKQLLMFSRHQMIEHRVLDVRQILIGMEKMIRRLLGADVELTLLPSTSVGRVTADAGQVEQIVMNLVVNARDAMPHGGKLVLETRNVELDAEYAAVHAGATPGSYVMLALTDTGVGMTKEVQARVFEPFFTTKEKGKGTGLGLSTVFGIVKKRGGHVWLYSEPGKGTTFRVYLPRTGASSDRISSIPPSIGGVKGSETILLVEDDEQVRGVACSILRRQGYRVLEASNGGEALMACEQHPSPIHLLLTDVVLPRMSGRQLADRLLALRPEMKLLFMSGYTDEAIHQGAVLDSGATCLQKPLTPDMLSRTVREVLDRRTNAS
jgi:two-component system cell cycle sensor histidine kinase/response regulator CckA